MHLWLTEGDADNEWNQMTTLARTTTPFLVYTIDKLHRLILHRGWPKGLNDVKEDFHRRFPAIPRRLTPTGIATRASARSASA
jgi:hypothetical protein